MSAITDITYFKGNQMCDQDNNLPAVIEVNDTIKLFTNELKKEEEELDAYKMKIIDSYELYKKNRLGIMYDCKEGKIGYWNYLKCDISERLKPDEIAIYQIFIKNELKRQGVFTTFLKYIIDDGVFNRIWILGLGTYAIFEFFKKFEYKGKKFDVGSDAVYNIF